MFAAAAVATAVEPTAAAQQNNYRTRKLHCRVFDEPDDDDAAVDIVAVHIGQLVAVIRVIVVVISIIRLAIVVIVIHVEAATVIRVIVEILLENSIRADLSASARGRWI